MSENNIRKDFLSSWAVNDESMSSFAASQESNKEKAERKEGYIICRKCYEIISSREIKCPNCGRVVNK